MFNWINWSSAKKWEHTFSAHTVMGEGVFIRNQAPDHSVVFFNTACNSTRVYKNIASKSDCSTMQKFFGATWLGLQSRKFKNIETLDFFL